MITTCACGTKLKVPDDAIGRKVRCPSCNAVFAAHDSAAAPAPAVEQADDRQNPDKPSETSDRPNDDFDRSERDDDRGRESRIEADEPPRKSRDRDDDRNDERDDDDRPRKRRGTRAEDEDDDRRDRRRSRADDDEDERSRGPKSTSGKAIASLIVGLFIPCIGGIVGLILAILALGDIRRSPRITGHGLAMAGMIVSIVHLVILGPGGCIVFALVMPAVQKVREAAARTQAMNNGKQIALAHHNFHDMFKRLPGPKGIGETNAGLSWRVTILPYIENKQLYDSVKDQPWDSQRNQGFGNKMPMTYEVLYREPVPGSTFFQYFTGPNTLYPTDDAVVSIPRSFTDGTSNTILFAEAASAVPWMKPADMKIDKLQPLPLPPQTFLAAMADATVRTVDRRRTSDNTIRLAIDPSDGLPLPMDW